MNEDLTIMSSPGHTGKSLMIPWQSEHGGIWLWITPDCVPMQASCLALPHRYQQAISLTVEHILYVFLHFCHNL